MGREIKFRAWDKKDKRMINIARFDFADWSIYTHLFGKPIDGLDCEIMQYTGLQDKNGKQIYEGDIVKDDDTISAIRYEQENARFVIDDYGTKGSLMEYGFDEDAGGYGIVDTNGFDDFYDISDKIEIIGNIHENPELLAR